MYTVFYEGEAVGSLKLREEGLYISFSAVTKSPSREGLYRLWLASPQPYCLGLAEPKGDSLQLKRRMSQREFKTLGPFDSALLLPHKAAPPEKPKKESENWQPRPDGTMLFKGPDHSLIALPTAESLCDSRLRYIYINGKKYTVFRY